MNALANSLARIWSANDRAPRLTGRGNPGCPEAPSHVRMATWARSIHSEISGVIRRIAPTVLLLAFNIFR